MNSAPSSKIVGWMRDTLEKKGMNTAALAHAVGERRAVVRKVLAGHAPLTVDQLVTWTQALELDVSDLMTLAPEGSIPDSLPQNALEHPDLDPSLNSAPAEGIEIDPYGLQAEQALLAAQEEDHTLVLRASRRPQHRRRVPGERGRAVLGAELPPCRRRGAKVQHEDVAVAGTSAVPADHHQHAVVLARLGAGCCRRRVGGEEG